MPKRLLIYSNDTTDHVSAKRREEGDKIKDKNNSVLSVLGQYSVLSESMRGVFPTNWIPQIYSMGISM